MPEQLLDEALPSPATESFRSHRPRPMSRWVRIGSAAAATLAVLAITVAVASTNSTSSPSSSSTTSRPSGTVPMGSFVWKASVVANVKLAPTAILVAADGVSAYAITVASTSPASTSGQLTLIDLATGQVERGSALPAASQLFLVGPTLYVLEPIAGKDGHVSGPWTLYRLRSGTELARVGPLPLGLSANAVPVTHPPRSAPNRMPGPARLLALASGDRVGAAD